MHVKLVENLAINQNDKITVYRATVVNNEDPDKLEKVKATIPNKLEGTAEKLPWIHPQKDMSYPSGNGINVPENGKDIAVIFPHLGSVYAGRYVGYWSDVRNALAGEKSTVKDKFDVDYPNTYGWINSIMTFFRENKKTKELEMGHALGASMKIEANKKVKIINYGELEVENKNKATFNNQGDVNLNVTAGNLNVDVSGGNISYNASGSATHTAMGEIKIASQQKISLNDFAILGSARITDEVKVFCPILMTMVTGAITKGNDKVTQNF